MISRDKNFVIIYNGEIYNFLSLKKTLTNFGYKFKSQTDTEVILIGYQKWGVKIFKKIEGMFALAIYDIKKNKVILARDYFGIKPLYYFKNKNNFLFASEIKAIKLLDPSIEDSPNWKINFLSFGFIPEPNTVLKNVFSLKNGHYLSYNTLTGKITLSSFCQKYHLKKIENQKLLNDIYHEIDNSIKSNLISDAKIAVSLSGGYDSGYIANIASQEQEMCSLSLDFKEKFLSEKNIINYIKRRLKIKNQKYLVNQKDFNKNLVKILKSYDQPSIDGLNIYFISQFAKKCKIKVLLSGIGSDEMLLGYKYDKCFPFMKYLYKYKKIIRLFCKILKTNNYKILNKFKFAVLNKDLFYYLFLRGIFNPYEISQILNIPLRFVIKTLNQNQISPNKINDYAYYSSIQNHFYLKSQLLTDADKMSMNFGVEIRVPYLNPKTYHLLINFFDHNNPLDYVNKKILKDHFQLLNSISTTKHGFTLPMENWINKLTQNYNLNNNSHWSKKWALYLLDKYKV